MIARLRLTLPLTALLLAACDGATKPLPDSGDPSTAAPDEDGDGFTVDQGDCDEGDPSVNPAATESCNGTDDDCDGEADEGLSAGWYPDSDGDGYGDDAGYALTCAPVPGSVEAGGDCDDRDDQIHPGADEPCDGVDNDCDGATDEDGAIAAALDSDGDGFGDPATAGTFCALPAGYVADASDCDDDDPAAFPGNPEVCDEADNDCDGTTDEGVTSLWYADLDGDGYGSILLTQDACARPEGYAADPSDCDDGDASVNPAAAEICDGIDNDCDGLTDDPAASGAPPWYLDSDGDGYGDPAASTPACSQPAGYVAAAADCDDADAAISPAGIEVCDGADNDCDGQTDEDSAVDAARWYPDGDGDGFGDPRLSVPACAAPAGWVADTQATDCNDGAANANPAAPEICDNLDNDCDGLADEDDATDALIWYEDADRDSFGDPARPVPACDQPPGTSSNDLDCDDASLSNYPGAPEYCDGVDNDCDGTADEPDAITARDWYSDGDGDGFGYGAPVTACDAPAGYAATSTDCDDAEATTFPGADEVCDGADNDCDGQTDESALDAQTFYADVDGDGYGDPHWTATGCAAGIGYVPDATDCDDLDDQIHPGAPEVCGGDDDDCDGLTDEADPGLTGASAWHRDSDSDGYGDPAATITACAAPAGYTADATDCDDTSAAISPADFEACNGYDDDCDGLIDDADTAVSGGTTWYRDSDGDGYGVTSATTAACARPAGYAALATDCDDARSGTWPGAAEVCDGLDNDCDGTADDGVLGSSAACPATDCAAVLSSSPGAASGNYSLNAGTFYCDMTTDGGGWTRVRQSAYVYGTGYDGTYYNTQGFTWDEVLFRHASGSVHAHCTYPESLTGCNNLGFQFAGENWGIAQNWGASVCGMGLSDYTGATRYIGGYDFIISRTASTSTIRLGTLEGIANCTTGDNPGSAYVDIYLRR